MEFNLRSGFESFFTIIKNISMKIVKYVSLFILLFFFSISLYSDEKNITKIKIGVLAKRGRERCMQKWSPTATYLSKQIPQYSFSIIPLGFDEVTSAVKNREVDFILVHPAFYIALQYDYGVKRIATLVNLALGKGYSEYAGVIFTRKNNENINKLGDIKGRSFMGVDKNAFAGWLMALRKFKNLGIDPYSDFSTLVFGGTHDEVVYAVMDGVVDAGCVRSDTLEIMEFEAKIDIDDFKILNIHKQTKNFPFLHSTRLYPEWPFAQLKSTSDELAKQVAIALLSMPSNSAASKASKCSWWTIPSDYRSVIECLQDIQIYPYNHYGEVSITQAMLQHIYFSSIVVILFGIILLFTLYVNRSKKNIENVVAVLKESEEQRLQSEYYLDKAQEIGHVGFWEYDILKDVMVWTDVNYKIFGIKSGGLLNHQTFLNTVHPEDKNYVNKKWDAALKDEPYDIEHRIIAKGKIKWIREKAEIEFNEVGEAIKAIGFTQDISEQKEMIEELEQMHKLKSLGLLGAGIAHDFNNILTVLWGNISMAKLNLSKGHPSIQFLEDSEKSMDRATNLSNQLLTFAKGGAPIKESIEMTILIKDIVSFDLVGSKVKPVFKFSKELWEGNVDKGQIEQVFSNLTINANQAMPKGGHLYISLENVIVKDKSIPMLNIGKYIKATVRDEGIGITVKRLQHIFDPYFSTKHSGNGLGLATVYSIINRHGGYITVNSGLNKGTIFTFYIPAIESQEKGESLEEESLKVIDSVLKDYKILVMDDEEMILELISEIVKSAGYSVATAIDGKTALDMYKKSLDDGNLFDVIIMDLTIPGGVGGKDAITDILKINQDAKCIVSSGYANDPILANYREYGFKGMVLKPFTPSQLIEVLDKVIRE